MSIDKIWLQMQHEDSFPTNFAMSIARATKIIIEDDEHGSLGIKIMDQTLRMKHFQQMSVACEFGDCLIAYHGENLTDDQIGALKIIHRSTKPWLLGVVVGSLMDRLNNPKITNKDFALSCATIIDQIQESDPNGNPTATAKVKSLVFEMAAIPDKK